MNQIDKFLKLNVKKTIIYLVVLISIYFIGPIFSPGSPLGMALAVFGSLILIIFLIAIFYNLVRYLLIAKPQDSFKKIAIKTFIATIVTPVLFSFLVDLLRLFISTALKESVYNTYLGVDIARYITFLFAILWFIIIFKVSLKRVSDKKQRRSLSIIIIIAILIYVALYFFGLV